MPTASRCNPSRMQLIMVLSIHPFHVVFAIFVLVLKGRLNFVVIMSEIMLMKMLIDLATEALHK